MQGQGINTDCTTCGYTPKYNFVATVNNLCPECSAGDLDFVENGDGRCVRRRSKQEASHLQTSPPPLCLPLPLRVSRTCTGCLCVYVHVHTRANGKADAGVVFWRALVCLRVHVPAELAYPYYSSPPPQPPLPPTLQLYSQHLLRGSVAAPIYCHHKGCTSNIDDCCCCCCWCCQEITTTTNTVTRIQIASPRLPKCILALFLVLFEVFQLGCGRWKITWTVVDCGSVGRRLLAANDSLLEETQEFLKALRGEVDFSAKPSRQSLSRRLLQD